MIMCQKTPFPAFSLTFQTHLSFWEGGCQFMVCHSRKGGECVREGGSRREHPQAVHGHQVLQRDRVIVQKYSLVALQIVKWRSVTDQGVGCVHSQSSIYVPNMFHLCSVHVLILFRLRCVFMLFLSSVHLLVCSVYSFPLLFCHVCSSSMCACICICIHVMI